MSTSLTGTRKKRIKTVGKENMQAWMDGSPDTGGVHLEVPAVIVLDIAPRQA